MPSSTEPAVRAHFVALALDALREAHPAAWPEAEVELADAIAAVRAAGRFGWLPVARLLELDRAGMARLGEEGLRQLVLDTMGRALRSPLWRGLLETLIRWLGVTPPQVARWAPRVHALAFRGVGRMHVPEADAQRAVVAFDGVPDACLSEGAYVASLGYALEFFFELTDTRGTVRVLDCDANAGHVRFELTLR